MRRLETLFTEAVGRNPDAPAVRTVGAIYSYREIDARANQIARALQKIGVRRADRVGIWIEKSPACVAATQAVLRTGACYVPLDPMGSPSRIAQIVRDAALRAVVTTSERRKRARLAGIGDVSFVSTIPGAGHRGGEDDAAKLSDAAIPQVPGTTEDDVAYILYTSGSTGKPKGVCIRHRNARAFVDWAYRELEPTARDRFANHAPLHFDLSVLDLYVAFHAGASVVPIPEAMSYLPDRLVDLLASQAITVWYSVPSALVLMAERGGLLEREDLRLRTIIFAGEVFPISPLRRLRDAFPKARLLNLYGPTETNVCTYHEVLSPIEEDQQSIPIGHACSENKVVALKDDRTLALPGEEGELVVSGGSVMLGYFGDEPLGDRPYFTGDLVRVRTDGAFEFVGRRDHQVKVRGHRIELGAIETALMGCDSVIEAAAVTIGTGTDARIRAFVVTRTGKNLDLLEAKRCCALQLPRWMTIDELRCIPELPRTPNGKIDRAALQRAE